LPSFARGSSFPVPGKPLNAMSMEHPVASMMTVTRAELCPSPTRPSRRARRTHGAKQGLPAGV
jgi:hypothetical protein